MNTVEAERYKVGSELLIVCKKTEEIYSSQGKKGEKQFISHVALYNIAQIAQNVNTNGEDQREKCLEMSCVGCNLIKCQLARSVHGFNQCTVAAVLQLSRQSVHQKVAGHGATLLMRETWVRTTAMPRYKVLKNKNRAAPSVAGDISSLFRKKRCVREKNSSQ